MSPFLSTLFLRLMVLGLLAAAASGVGTVVAAEAASKEGPVAEAPSEPEEGKRRPLRSLLEGATPEERARLAEERKRLSATAAGFGTDPTAIVGYYQLGYGHNALTNGLRTEVASAVVQFPVTPNWLFRVAMPYVWADPNQPRGSTMDGTSDMTVRMGGRLYASENFALLIGTDASFPTASEKQLGFGKYTLGPGGAVAVPMPRARSLLFVLVQDFNSVGGDPSRANLHFMQVQSAVNTIWSERWWTIIQGTWNMDWNHNRKTTMNLLGEVGHNFDNHWNVFAGAGGGVVGQDTFLGLDWTVQAGVRWVFRTPLIPETFFGGPLGK
ncbi:MAG: hypothetical protein ACREIS_01315 [Nitrospiraceae bacterium]